MKSDKNEQYAPDYDFELNDHNSNSGENRTFSVRNSPVNSVKPKPMNNHTTARLIVPPFISIILLIIFYNFVLGFFEPGSFLPRLFLPENASVLSMMVPGATLFFFLWSIFDLIFIAGRITLERRILSANSTYLTSDNTNISELLEISRYWRGSKDSLSFYRISYLIEYLSMHRNAQSVYELFRYQTELETDKASSKYTLAKIAIWAMPILGFIGTVLGISMAVGDFSGFLTQDVENVNLVKGELAKVATGLSFAFDTTLLGLVLSMLAMFLSGFVQNYEQKFMNQLEETGYSIIDNTAITAPVNQSTTEDILMKFNLLMDERLAEMSKVMDGVISQLDKTTDYVSREISRIPEKTLGVTSDLVRQIEHSLLKISSDFASLPQSMQSGTQSFVRTMESATFRIIAELDRIPALLNTNHDQLKSTLTQMNSRVDEMKQGYNDFRRAPEANNDREVTQVLNEIKNSLNALGPAIDALSRLR
jgi:biopolymer transport protein ExbB/TolQ